MNSFISFLLDTFIISKSAKNELNPETRTTSTWLVLVNLTPILGTLFLEWDPNVIVLIYSIESLIIGVFSLITAMLVNFHPSSELSDRDGVTKVLVAGGILLTYLPFFAIALVHYMALDNIVFKSASMIKTGANPIIRSLEDINSLETFLQNEFIIIVLLILSHSISFYIHQLKFKEFKKIRFLTRHVLHPFGRVLSFQLIVGLSFYASLNLDKGFGLMIIAMLAKTIVDLNSHANSHLKISDKTFQSLRSFEK